MKTEIIHSSLGHYFLGSNEKSEYIYLCFGGKEDKSKIIEFGYNEENAPGYKWDVRSMFPLDLLDELERLTPYISWGSNPTTKLKNEERIALARKFAEENAPEDALARQAYLQKQIDDLLKEKDKLNGWLGVSGN